MTYGSDLAVKDVERIYRLVCSDLLDEDGRINYADQEWADAGRDAYNNWAEMWNKFAFEHPWPEGITEEEWVEALPEEKSTQLMKAYANMNITEIQNMERIMFDGPKTPIDDDC